MASRAGRSAGPALQQGCRGPWGAAVRRGGEEGVLQRLPLAEAAGGAGARQALSRRCCCRSLGDGQSRSAGREARERGHPPAPRAD